MNTQYCQCRAAKRRIYLIEEMIEICVPYNDDGVFPTPKKMKGVKFYAKTDYKK